MNFIFLTGDDREKSTEKNFQKILNSFGKLTGNIYFMSDDNDTAKKITEHFNKEDSVKTKLAESIFTKNINRISIKNVNYHLTKESGGKNKYVYCLFTRTDNSIGYEGLQNLKDTFYSVCEPYGKSPNSFNPETEAIIVRCNRFAKKAIPRKVGCIAGVTSLMSSLLFKTVTGKDIRDPFGCSYCISKKGFEMMNAMNISPFDPVAVLRLCARGDVAVIDSPVIANRRGSASKTDYPVNLIRFFIQIPRFIIIRIGTATKSKK